MIRLARKRVQHCRDHRPTAMQMELDQVLTRRTVRTGETQHERLIEQCS